MWLFIMGKKKAQGISISLVNSFFTVLTFIVFCFILVISTNVNRRFHAVEEALDKYIVCQQSSDQIKESANYLTDQARLFVVTHKRDFVDAYITELEETKRQEKALEALESVCSKKDVALQRLRIALEQGQSLINMELYAMRLVFETEGIEDMPQRLREISVGAHDKLSSREQMLERAITNLFGDGYLIYKMRINENCNLTVAAIAQQIKDELNLNADELGVNINRLRILFLELLIVNVLIFIAYGYLVLVPLGKFQHSINDDKKLGVIGSSEFRNLAESYNEIYEIKAQNEKSLLKKAEYDALTGILNRRAFDQICETSAEKKQKIALLLIDLDNFKHINDTYGHTGGDNVLKGLASTLRETFREDDYVARVGGDEFAAILPDCEQDAANAIRHKIAEVNDRLSALAEQPASISVGVAFSGVGYSQALYEKADKALYVVKEKGKRGCEVYGVNGVGTESE